MTPEERKIYNKEWYEKNEEKRKEYYEKNKEKIAQRKKQYHEKNKEKISQHNKTPERKKGNTISKWKQRGIIFHDWDLLYDVIYMLTSHCDNCNVFLQGLGNDRKCLDHDHSITHTDNVRNVLCCRCNVKRG